MPLYMDIHTVDSDDFSAEDVVKAHMNDLAIQDKFGVTQLKYWVNEHAKTIFCLMEGPNKDACNQVHLQSHGNTACNIIEVADDEYQLFMGRGTDVNDLATTESGALDPGYRTLLLVNAVAFDKRNASYQQKIIQTVRTHNGVIVRDPSHEVLATFTFANEALACANEINNELFQQSERYRFNISLVSGRPVDEDGETFFEQTKLKVQSLASLGLNQQLYLDNETMVLAKKEGVESNNIQTGFTTLDSDELSFAVWLSKVVHENHDRSDFTTEELFFELGISKSQANRKIKSISGMSPNQLIQEHRLFHAIKLMINSDKTIAEIAYESGFNSPSYFTRIFKKRYKIAPSDFLIQ